MASGSKLEIATLDSEAAGQKTPLSHSQENPKTQSIKAWLEETRVRWESHLQQSGLRNSQVFTPLLANLTKRNFSDHSYSFSHQIRSPRKGKVSKPTIVITPAPKTSTPACSPDNILAPREPYTPEVSSIESEVFEDPEESFDFFDGCSISTFLNMEAKEKQIRKAYNSLTTKTRYYNANSLNAMSMSIRKFESKMDNLETDYLNLISEIDDFCSDFSEELGDQKKAEWETFRSTVETEMRTYKVAMDMKALQVEADIQATAPVQNSSNPSGS